MAGSRAVPVRSALLGACGRLLVILTVWAVVVGIGTGGFFAPRGAETQPSAGDLVAFACSMAIACAASALVAFRLGGQRRWAAAVALAVALTAAAIVVMVYVALWMFPMLVRSRMDAWEFLRLREGVPLWGAQLVRFQVPLAALAGGLAGVVAGLLFRLGRRRPGPATWLALGFLFACASSPVQDFVFALVIWSGRILRMLIDSWGLVDEQITATAIFLGAVAGAVIAGLVMRKDRRGARVTQGASTSSY